jgi:hypothetical protein
MNTQRVRAANLFTNATWLRAKAIVLGDANIEKKKSDKTQNFICIVGERGKVLLTIFSDQ